MKKVSVVAVALALVIFCTAIYGWSQTAPVGAPPAAKGQVDVKAFRQFQKETLPLRDELMAKRLELRNEYAQANPNYDRIAGLQKEMIDLRTKIQTTAQKYNVPAGHKWMAGKGRFWHGGWCQGAGSGWGQGPGAGRGCGGGGYGNVNCPVVN